MGRLNVKLCGIELDNPVLAASGTFGYGLEFAGIYDINLLGSFSFKGTTPDMLNAVGLQNPGVDAVIRDELPRLREVFHKPVMANIAARSPLEYAEAAEKLAQQEQVGWLEVNISCPNVRSGGMSFGADPKAAAEVTRAVRAVTEKPVIMKLTPNVTDIAEIARACEDAGADGISLINTLLGMRIDLNTKKPLLANTTGGLSGPAVFPVALRMVWQVYKAVIDSAEKVCEMMLAGATAVEVGAQNLRDPLACLKIIRRLPEVLDRYGVKNIADLTGAAHC